MPRGGIYEWQKAECHKIDTRIGKLHSSAWALSLCGHTTGAFKHRKAVSFQIDLCSDPYPVPSPLGALMGLAPQTKLQVPPNWNMTHYKSVEFLWNLNVKHPRTNVKLPYRRLIFWQRFCPYQWSWILVNDWKNINSGASTKNGFWRRVHGVTKARTEVRLRPRNETSLVPPYLNLRHFGSKCTAWKKKLATLLRLFGVHPLIRHLGHCVPLVTPLVWHFVTKCAALKFAEPWMLNHF